MQRRAEARAQHGLRVAACLGGDRVEIGWRSGWGEGEGEEGWHRVGKGEREGGGEGAGSDGGEGGGEGAGGREGRGWR